MKYYTLLLLAFMLFSCVKTERDYTYDNIDFKQEMRDFVVGISRYAKQQRADFIIIPQNGVEILTEDGTPYGDISQNYMDAIDAQAQEDLNYGYDADDVATPSATKAYLKSFLDKAKGQQKTILITDYCSSPVHISDAFQQNAQFGYVGFVASQRELNIVPSIPVYNAHPNDVVNMGQVHNFLYLINPDNFQSKSDLIQRLSATNYDLIIMDMFFVNQVSFTASEIAQLKHKANGGERLVVSYMSIGEAEDYRFYWQSSWNADKPIWLDMENPDWAGNYKVRYWEKDWQKIIYGNHNSYIKKIIDAGFDGAYLDIIDAYSFFEERYGNN